MRNMCGTILAAAGEMLLVRLEFVKRYKKGKEQCK